ncbi:MULTISPECIES: recombinase family protein [Bacillus cereus group]|uniref:recombinase family protein n=1 Tax=Bacillus cereus group TaxID=86661 RepID=UPI000DE58100|nr:recombinase family protein [Bacillus cereus]MDA2404077.1 recombinase family protein [Bacillus cereus]MDZ4643606.1 recombinase family protein [Bacillus cereus]HDR3326343.1 recombinase family protein [Bacillus thuringiensis]
MYKPFSQVDYKPSDKPKALYIRKSKKSQGKTEIETIESHLKRLTDFCKDQGWNNYVIYNDYVAKSTDINRIEYNKMLNACLDGKHDLIVVVEESRLYRTVNEQTNVYEELKGTDIAILSIREGYIFPNDRNQFLTNIIRGAMNQQELENFAYRMNVKVLASAKEGKYVNKLPFGYFKDKEKLTPHPIESKTFRFIVDKVLEGYVIAEIIGQLNQLGYTTKSNKKWKDVGTITRMLANRVYLGESHYYSKMFDEDVIKRDTHQPLLTIEEFQKVNTMIRSRSRNPQGVRYTKVNTVLDRLVVCGICGSRLPIHKSWTNKEGITSYQIGKCQKVIGEYNEKKCPNKSISLKELLPHFYNAIESYKDALREEIDSVEIDITNDKKIKVMEQIKDTSKRISEIQEEIQNAKSYLIKGVLTEADYVGLVPPLEKDIKELNVVLEDNERILASLNDYDRTAVIQYTAELLNNIDNESIENQNRVFRVIFEELGLINTVDAFAINLKEKDVSY